MGSLEDEFLEILHRIRGPGHFATSGQAVFVVRSLELPSGEEISLPLQPCDVEAFLDCAELAPYGYGEETLYDTDVRRCWQISGDQLPFGDEPWAQFIGSLAQRAGQELGVMGEVVALPHKLLLYNTEGFFLSHRDTEKVPGMFGSLVVCLPSDHEGGAVLVRHEECEERVDFSSGSRTPDELSYAAWYADCEHEVRPIIQGHRLCLVCHLILRSPHQVSLPHPDRQDTLRLAPVLAKLMERRAGFVVVLLSHRYTQEGISVNTLKGHDRQRAAVLFDVADLCGLKARIALVSLHQEENIDDPPDDFLDEMEELADFLEPNSEYYERLTASHWRNREDHHDPLGEIEIDRERILSHEPLGTGRPDETFGSGYEGNDGEPMERWFRRCAVVIWPRH